MDVIFTIDASGSIGASYFQVALDWIVEIIDSGLSRGSRVAFIRFATSSQILLDFDHSESMSTAELEDYAEHIVYTGGNTNTVAALEQDMSLFSSQGNPYASWINILITDGNPYVPGGDTDVCSRASRMKSMGITNIIIGVGSSWNPANVDCLVTSDSDIIYVTSYSSGQLATILPALTQTTCPVSYNLIISEVQLDLESSSKGSRFIEAYNPSTSVTLTDLDIDGIFEGSITSDSSKILPQSSYLVIYDYNAPTMISCQDCSCTKSNNLCTDAIYLPCGCSSCSCYFGGSSMSNTNWHVSLMDSTNQQAVDSLTYDSSTWPQILTGYTYALKYVGYDNQLGSNWEQSCNTRGTPGSDPVRNCTWTCTNQQCQLNGASSANCITNGNTQQCNCNSNSYYFADRTCYSVPPPGSCVAYWYKNETTGARYVEFEWGAAATDRDHKYILNYYTPHGLDQVTTSSRVKVVADYDYGRGTTKVAGYVQTQIASAVSTNVSCYPSTMSPTVSPTHEPPYVYISGDVCEKERCSCYEQNPYNCTGDDVTKSFSADDSQTQYISITRMPEDYEDSVYVFWQIWSTPNYVESSNTTNSTASASSSNAVDIRNLLVAVNSTNSTNNQTQSGIGITPTYGVLEYNTSTGEDLKIGIIIAKQTVADGGSRYRWYTLNITVCNTTNTFQDCTSAYPSTLRMKVDVLGHDQPYEESKTQKEMPTWLWWLIGALVIFAAILALLGYRYWWKNKQTTQELNETNDELNHAIEENELGFGKDLNVGDVQFNPMATGVPGQKKAPELFGGEIEKRNNDASNVRADVAVEKFAHREQFGQQQGAKRPGGNDLSQPLLG
jgi:hypothetical protein